MEEHFQKLNLLKSPKRKTSFFKKRKKPPERTLLKIKKKRNSKKIILYFIGFLVLIFILAGILYLFKTILLENLYNNSNMSIVSPNGGTFPDNSTVSKLIQKSGLDVSDVSFASNSATVTFQLENFTNVRLSTDKDIKAQLELVRAIEQELLSQNKRAIYIDLRYNKPIVSLQ